MVQAYRPLYSVKEVSELIGTNKNYIYTLIKSGKLPYLLINGTKKVRGSDLENFIENYPAENKESSANLPSIQNSKK